MRGLIETAIEREVERLDELLESPDPAPTFFAPRSFRRRTQSHSAKFALRATSRRSLATPRAPQYLN
jgi:hypothetical protein